jgi:hypothetical protein
MPATRHQLDERSVSGRLGALLSRAEFYAAATAAAAGEVMHRDRHRVRDAHQVALIQEEFSDFIPRRCRNSSLFLLKRDRETGARSHRNLPCGSLYCPDCSPQKKAAWSRALEKYGWRTVLYITMRPGFQDWRNDGHVALLFESMLKARRLLKRIRAICPKHRAEWRVDPECKRKNHYGADAAECRRCWAATVRRGRNCIDCHASCGDRRADPHHRCGSDAGWFGYANVPEWNTHKPGARGNLHADLLSDIALGEFTRPELSAILERAGFGWACKMVPVADISHALKALTTRRLEARMLGGRGASWSVSEALRYGIKDLADGASHQGALGRYPKHRRRISSNVTKLDRRLSDPRFEYDIARDALGLLAWYDQDRADVLVSAVAPCRACAEEAVDYPELADELAARGGCVCDNGAHMRAPPEASAA